VNLWRRRGRPALELEAERHRMALQESALRLAEARHLARDMERWPRAVDAIVVGLLCPTEPACGRDLCAICIARAARERARAQLERVQAEFPELPWAVSTCSPPSSRYHFAPDLVEVIEQAARPVPWLRRRPPGQPD